MLIVMLIVGVLLLLEPGPVGAHLDRALSHAAFLWIHGSMG
jgi:hypothetical protein